LDRDERILTASAINKATSEFGAGFPVNFGDEVEVSIQNDDGATPWSKKPGNPTDKWWIAFTNWTQGAITAVEVTAEVTAQPSFAVWVVESVVGAGPGSGALPFPRFGRLYFDDVTCSTSTGRTLPAPSWSSSLVDNRGVVLATSAVRNRAVVQCDGGSLDGIRVCSGFPPIGLPVPKLESTVASFSGAEWTISNEPAVFK
jgi:hypothetical protein